MKHQIITKDLPTVTVGGGVMGVSSLAEAATAAQQIGMIFGAVLVIVTLIHRLLMIWNDIRN